jgi:C_GCAxxG_C_C family probable redox protein
MTKSEIAVENFNKYNCAQAVSSAYVEDFGIDVKTILRIAMPFGAGMGRLGETCGAVTGAYMVIGLKCWDMDITPNEKKELTYKKVQEFAEEFKKINNTTQCKELINCILTTEEGQKKFKDENLHQNVCAKAVKNAVEILEKIL